MAQKGFGRRNVPSRPGAAHASAANRSPAAVADDADPVAASSSSTRRSIAVMAGVAAVVTVAAGGLAYALSAAGANGSSTASSTCRPGDDRCINQYQVALSCNGQQEQRSVSVNAATSDEAEAKAERYNRGCRSRGSAFVAAMLHGAARSYHGGSRARETRMADASASKTRRTFRFRRR